MAAPTPRPAALKLLEGRGGGRDSGGRPVPTPPAFRRLPPSKPAGMSRVAAAKWDQLVDELTRLNLISVVQGPALEMACESYARWHAARAIRKRPVKSGGGVLGVNSQGLVKSPAVAIEESAAKEYRGWCAEFGLTPAGEMRLATPEASDGDEDNPFAR